MNKQGISLGLIGLVVGLAIGFFTANNLNRRAVGTATAPNSGSPAAPPQGGSNPGAQMQDVQSVLEKAKNEPDNYDAQIAAGDMFAQIQRFEKALEYYKQAYKSKPDDVSANVKLGNAYFDLKKYTDAETYYAKALKIKPESPDIRTDYGLTFFLRDPNDVDRAISEYRKALENDPKHELALQNLSVALNQKGDKEELAKAIRKLKEINPNNPVIAKYDNPPG